MKTACWGRSRSRTRSLRTRWCSPRARPISSSGPARHCSGATVRRANRSGTRRGRRSRGTRSAIRSRGYGGCRILATSKRPGILVQPASDLDGDGTADIVWAFRGTPSFLALSGKDGSMLWTYTAEADGRGGPDLARPGVAPGRSSRFPGRAGCSAHPVRGTSMATASSDLIAAFVLLDDVPPEVHPPEVEGSQP